MADCSIRFAGPEDLPAILGFIRGLAAYEKLEDQVVATEGLLWEWIFEKKKAEVLLAEADGKAVGFALFFHNFSTFLGRAGIYLEDLYVLPEYRGRGLGRQVIRCLMDRGRQLGYDTLGVREIYNWNTGSVRCFTSCGFVPVEKTEQGWRYEAKL